MIEAQGRIESITKPIKGKGYLVTVRIDALPEGLDGKLLDVTLKEHREKRSKDANALLWACIGDISKATGIDKWDVYLKLLKRYGRYTYIAVRRSAVEMVKRQWRECEEIGPVSVNGTPCVQMLCYYGSSTYDTHEMSILLDGTLSEMEEIGIQRPASSQIRRALEEWERNHNG